VRILWLAPEAPVPPLSGGRERARRMLLYLAARHRVALATFAGEADQVGLDDLEADVARIVRLDYGSRWPGAAIRRVVRRFQPEAIHVQGPSMMRVVPRGYGGRVVYDCHDAPLEEPSDNTRSTLTENDRVLIFQREPPPARWRALSSPFAKGEVADPQGRTEGVFAEKPANLPYSAKMWGRVDAVIAVSDADAVRLADHFPARWVHVLPNGVDPAYWGAVDGPPEPHTLLFPAALNWEPNRRAALDLVTRVLPALQQDVPDVRVIVAGRMPDGDLAARVAGHPAVALIADPPDMRPLFARAAAIVVPVENVSGTRIKILQALAAGRPVISTPDGAAGLNLVAGEHLLVAEMADFAGAAARLLLDPDLGARLCHAGREVIDRYSWVRHLPALDEVYP
jgi:glycosyltransferase involved in cell wall biosynthesis